MDLPPNPIACSAYRNTRTRVLPITHVDIDIDMNAMEKGGLTSVVYHFNEKGFFSTLVREAWGGKHATYFKELIIL